MLSRRFGAMSLLVLLLTLLALARTTSGLSDEDEEDDVDSPLTWWSPTTGEFSESSDQALHVLVYHFLQPLFRLSSGPPKMNHFLPNL